MLALIMPSWFLPLVYKLLLLAFVVLSFRGFRKHWKAIKQEPEPNPSANKKQNAESFRPKLDLDIETSPILKGENCANSEAKPYYLTLDTESFDAIEELDTFTSQEAHSPIIALSWQVLDENKNLIREETHIIRRQGVMTDKAKSIHLISEEALHQGESLETVLRSFGQELEQVKVLVAHNLDYHLLAIRSAFDECELDAHLLNDKSLICTMMKGLELGFKRRKNGERAYPALEELFAHLYFSRPKIKLSYRSKTLRDIRLVSACLRRL